jgi:hypothetical protein
METISSAIKFNALKHLYQHLVLSVEDWKDLEWKQVESKLKELGDNQFDVYTGPLTSQDIISQTADIIIENNAGCRSDLQKWLGKKGYREVILSDNSRWIIREGMDSEKYIHLHPGRGQECIKRIKASHLKTAIMLLIVKPVPGAENQVYTTQQINKIRSEKLGLSPVKSISQSKKIMEALIFLRGV